MRDETAPERGDLVWVNFNPQAGHEQAGHRPALVISPKAYNMRSKFVFVCPITSNDAPWPWKVFLPEGGVIGGAVLTDQLKSVDRLARKLVVKDRAPQSVTDDVLARLALLCGADA